MNNFRIWNGNSKYHVNASDRDALLLQGAIEPIGPKEYRYINPSKPVKVFTSFPALAQLSLLTHVKPVRRSLGLCTIFEHKGKRRTEHEETVEGLQLRLQSQPLSA